MFKFWFYVIVLVLLGSICLALGASNSQTVVFDFLFVKQEISLAMVLVIGIVVGIILGLYLSLLFCLKMWAKAHGAKVDLKHAKKEAEKQIVALEQNKEKEE